MSYRSLRVRTAVAAGFATVAVGGSGGCTAAPVSPLPAQPPAPSVSPPSQPPSTAALGTPTAALGTASAARPRPVVRTPRTRSAEPTASSSCLGAVRRELDLRTTELSLVQSMCFSVGGVLSVRGIGPGEISIEPDNLVSGFYEGGVTVVRFVRPGTVTVSIPENGRRHEIVVVVRP